MSKSLIEQDICSGDFSYLAPYFYNNPYALRCELGRGDDRESFRISARRRAQEILRLLFPGGADAVIFNIWTWDISSDGGPEEELYGSPEEAARVTEQMLEKELFRLRFINEKLLKYRHTAVKCLPGYEEPGGDGGFIRRDRIVCYSDGRGFDENELIDIQLADEVMLDIGLVSFENECILSVYDDRGCDIVFADAAHMAKAYPLLKPYFLQYDLEEMERRFTEAQKC